VKAVLPKTCRTSRFVFVLALVTFLLVAGALWAGEPDGPAKPQGARQLMNRIDFGNAYIMGQSLKSGAVYLMHRKQSDIKSMLKIREDYRDEILEDFQGPREQPSMTLKKGAQLAEKPRATP
jgi:hypothetical protein